MERHLTPELHKESSQPSVPTEGKHIETPPPRFRAAGAMSSNIQPAEATVEIGIKGYSKSGPLI